MKTAEIKCISRVDGNANEITHIGGTTSNRTRWKQSLEKAIIEIESKEWEYFVQQDGQQVKVVVGIDMNGKKTIMTEEQAEAKNILLALPACP